MEAIDYAEHVFMEVWIGRDGERHGPYTEVEVRQWLRSGQVSASDLGWYEGMADWQPLSSLFPEEIQREPEAAPPAPTTSSVPPLPQAGAIPVEADYAGFWQRFGAWVIDLIVLAVPSSIVFYAMGGMTAYEHVLGQIQAGADASNAFRDYVEATQGSGIAVTVLGFLYYTLFECSKWQATPGKLALRLRVTDVQGEGITLSRSATRNAVRLTSIVTGLIPFVCYLAVAWTQRKQGLHDLLAHTLVLNGRPKEGVAQRPPSHGDQGSFNA